MRIRVLGGGWYGCHVALGLIREGHHVEVHEKADRLFSGASGANPARLHLGFHYPRSHATRALSQANYNGFMEVYGDFTRGIPVNIYAIANDHSLVDFGNYVQTLNSEVELITIARPEEFGLRNVEGAVLTGERHILVNRVRQFFEDKLRDHVGYGSVVREVDDTSWDITIDCTFCSVNRIGVERYEPCVTFIYEGPWDKAVTIMDGQFPSFYPFYEPGTVSLTSAAHTPIAKCKTTEEAHAILEDMTQRDFEKQREQMAALMTYFYPAFRDDYRYVECRTAVRAMPVSAADSRLFDCTVGSRSIRLRAGKIDAILAAADQVKSILRDWRA